MTSSEITSVKSKEITSRLKAKTHIHTVPRCPPWSGGWTRKALTSESTHVGQKKITFG